MEELARGRGGGALVRALRFWPDTRKMISDVVGFAGSNHGTTNLGACVKGLANVATQDVRPLDVYEHLADRHG